jgi:hypothetical protein
VVVRGWMLFVLNYQKFNRKPGAMARLSKSFKQDTTGENL